MLPDPHIRLVTVMGGGGMGKTCLILEVGRHFVKTAEEHFTDGIYFVDLVPVDNPQNIVTAIADAFEFRFYTDQRTPEHQLFDFLYPKKHCLYSTILNICWLVQQSSQTSYRQRPLSQYLFPRASG